MLFVHGFVDHARNFYIAAQRKPSYTIFGFPPLNLEKREPGVKKEVELLYPAMKNLCEQEMSEFVKDYKYG